jgi:hypothetical protein
MPDTKDPVTVPHSKEATEVSSTAAGHTINASGHKQELERIFNPLALYGYAVTTGNTWITIGGSIVCTRRATKRIKLLTISPPGRGHLQWRTSRRAL